jgi:outer membrane protein
MKQIIYCLSLFVSYTLPIISQVDTLSLYEMIELAKKNNAVIAIAEIGIKQNESHLREAKASRYPAIFFHSHILHSPEDGYNEAITNGGEYGVQITTNVPLYDGGVRSTYVDQSTNAILKSRINFQKSSSEIAFAVRTQYYEIIRAEHELIIRQETVQRLQEYLSFLNQLRLGGNATESDVLKAKVDLNNAIISVDQTKQSVQKAKLVIVNIIGRPLNQDIEVLPLDGKDSLAVPIFTLEANHDYQLSERDAKSADYDITIAKGERFPTLTLAGDLGALGVRMNEFKQDFGYSILLSLDVPIFSWGAIDNRIEQKELAKEQLNAQLVLQRRELETEWRSTLSDLELFRKNLSSYRNNISEAEKNYLSAKSRFVGGSGSNLEVLDAQQLWVEAKLNYNSTLFQYRSSLSALFKLSGK